MPQAVTHFLLPALLVALLRDYYIKKKERRSFPLHYVLIAGIGGVLPDIDILVFLLLQPFGLSFYEVHRTYTHSLLVVLLFLFLGVIFHHSKIKALGKHKLKLGIIFYLLSFGIFTHIFLDALISGETIKLLYPLSHSTIWTNLVDYLPQPFNVLFTPLLDGIVLIIWIIYLELKHKISDFI